MKIALLHNDTGCVITLSMNLKDYVREIGVQQFAKRFRVSERAALSWQYGARRPRLVVAKRIVDNSPVTWAGIYNQESAGAPKRSEPRAST